MKNILTTMCTSTLQTMKGQHPRIRVRGYAPFSPPRPSTASGGGSSYRFSSLIVAGLSCVVLLIGLSACSETDKGSRAVARLKLLKRVPADTPYVAASSRELPESLSVHMLKAASLSENGDPIRLALESDDSPEGSARHQLLKLAHAFNAELEGKLTPEGLASLGFPLNGRSLVYGLGILPVSWIETLDPAKVDAFLDRVETRAGVKSQRATLGEIGYRRFDFGDLLGILAQKDGYLVAALVPGNSETELLPLVFGDRKPEKSLADTGEFKKFNARHGFLGYGEGYIDLVQLVEMGLGESQGINAQVLQALGAEPESVSPACRNLVRYMVQSVPRFGFGFTEAKADRYTMQAVVETSPAVADWLKRLPAPVPGLGSEDDAMFSLGMGIDLPLLRDGLKALLGIVLEQGKGCEDVDQERLVQNMQALDLMLNPMFAGIKGFDLAVDRVEVDPATGEPKSVDARFVLAAADPRGMFGMLAMLNPRLATLQIPADGTPVELPLKEVAPGAPPAWVAIKGEALGLFVSPEAPKDVDKVLTTPPEPSVLFSLSYNVEKLLQEVGPSLEQGIRTLEGEDAENARKAYEGLKHTASLYDQVRFDVLGDEQGLILSGRVLFNENSRNGK